MDQIIAEIVSQFGALGVLMCAVAFIIYYLIKENKSAKRDTENIKENTSKLDIVLENQRILTQRVESIESRLDARIDRLMDVVSSQPSATVREIKSQVHEDMLKASENMQLQTKLAPKIHSVIRKYKELTNSDHIFCASFHNGTKSITGMPYYKFDIISERTSPEIENDSEFAPLYQNVDIMRHDKLPQILTQEGCIHCFIDDDGNSPMEEWDYIMYCRMVGRGIKQIALVLMHNKKDHRPLGFIGIIRYDNQPMNIDELKQCGEELENIYDSFPLL